MTTRKIVTFDHPIIRKKTKPVTAFNQALKDTIADMKATVLAERDPEGIGLAANQVGLDQRIFVAKIGKEFLPFINPEIIKFSKDTDDLFEGCLSIPNLFGFVKRPKEVTLKFQNPEGKTFIRSFKGLSAKIVQHETDHLNGKLFLDHVLVQTRELYRFTGTDDKGDPMFEKIKLTNSAN